MLVVVSIKKNPESDPEFKGYLLDLRLRRNFGSWEAFADAEPKMPMPTLSRVFGWATPKTRSYGRPENRNLFAKKFGFTDWEGLLADYLSTRFPKDGRQLVSPADSRVERATRHLSAFAGMSPEEQGMVLDGMINEDLIVVARAVMKHVAGEPLPKKHRDRNTDMGRRVIRIFDDRKGQVG